VLLWCDIVASEFHSKPDTTAAMFTVSRSLVAIACFTCSLTAFGQENSLEELFNSNQETSSEEDASVTGEALAPVTFEDLPFTEYDLDFREWSDATGKFSVIGKFDGLGDGSIWIIRKDNQKRIEVKIEILAPDDAELVKHIKENMKSVEEIQLQREAKEVFADTEWLIQLVETIQTTREKAFVEGEIARRDVKVPSGRTQIRLPTSLISESKVWRWRESRSGIVFDFVIEGTSVRRRSIPSCRTVNRYTKVWPAANNLRDYALEPQGWLPRNPVHQLDSNPT